MTKKFVLIFAVLAVLICATASWSEPVAIVTGGAHSLLLDADGSLWAWGANRHGQLGLGDNNNRNAPTQVGTDTDWKSVNSFGSHTVALKSDGSLWVWGWNHRGQLGLGDNVDRNVPVQIGTDTDWKSVPSVGLFHTVAIKNDGSMWAWGENNDGELGLGDNRNRSTPTRIGTDTDWKSVSTGSAHTVAIKDDGSMWAWGWNYYGSLGLGDNRDRNAPTRIGTDTDWKSVSAGVVHTVAIKNNGSMWAWGDNSSGQLGLGNRLRLGIRRNRNVPTRVGRDTNWKSVSTGRHTVAIKNDGSLWAWGNNSFGQLGLRDSVPRRVVQDLTWGLWGDNRYAPERVGADADWASVSVGGNHTVALKTDGSVWAWGNNDSGQLGLRDNINRSLPERINR